MTHLPWWPMRSLQPLQTVTDSLTEHSRDRDTNSLQPCTPAYVHTMGPLRPGSPLDPCCPLCPASPHSPGSPWNSTGQNRISSTALLLPPSFWLCFTFKVLYLLSRRSSDATFTLQRHTHWFIQTVKYICVIVSHFEPQQMKVKGTFAHRLPAGSSVSFHTFITLKIDRKKCIKRIKLERGHHL